MPLTPTTDLEQNVDKPETTQVVASHTAQNTRGELLMFQRFVFQGKSAFKEFLSEILY